MLMEVSSEGSPSHGQKSPFLTRITREVGEGFSHAIALPPNATDLLRISMCLKSIKDKSKAFAGFAKTVTSKLDLSNIHSSRKDKTFSLTSDIGEGK